MCLTFMQVLHNKERDTSAASQHSDAVKPVPQLHSVATTKLSTMSTPEEPVVGSLTGTQYVETV